MVPVQTIGCNDSDACFSRNATRFIKIKTEMGVLLQECKIATVWLVVVLVLVVVVVVVVAGEISREAKQRG